MANLIYNTYFKSKDIKVFPSSFRGTYKTTKGITPPEIVFDPESRLNTEANFILPKTTLGKSDYILSYSEIDNKISFVLGGYYFELLQVSDYLEEIKDKYIGIKLRTITLQEAEAGNTGDSTRQTKILSNWDDANNPGDILDALYEASSGNSADNQYYFTGLKVIEDNEVGVAAKIKLFINNSSNEAELNQTMCLPTVTQGEGANTLLHGTGLIARYENQTVVGLYNENKNTSLFEVGGGTASSPKNALDVSIDKTIINTDVEITGETVITGDTTIEGDTYIKGNTYIDNSITVAGKVVSDNTSDTDSRKTLTTKGYIEDLVDSLDKELVGQDGNYLKTISQSNGIINAVTQPFDTSVSSTSDNTNTPTSKAVYTFVTDTINGLDVAETGADDTYIQKIKEENGKIITTAKSFSTTIDKDSDDKTAPTVKTVYTYVENAKTELNSKITEQIKTLDVDAVGGDGHYLQVIEQTDGKIIATTNKFDVSISSASTDKNTPTSKAVSEFVAGELSKLWYTAETKTSDSENLQTLQSIILDAVYPVGSIYSCYSTSLLATCPIATNLGGTWAAIDAGRFLCAADTDVNSMYGYAKTGGYAGMILKPHTHTSSYAATTVTTSVHTGHTHGMSKITGNDTGTGNYEGFDPNAGNTILWKHGFNTDEAGRHTHTIDLPKITLSTEGEYPKNVTNDNANLPPYVAVYMWKRIK